VRTLCSGHIKVVTAQHSHKNCHNSRKFQGFSVRNLHLIRCICFFSTLFTIIYPKLVWICLIRNSANLVNAVTKFKGALGIPKAVIVVFHCQCRIHFTYHRKIYINIFRSNEFCSCAIRIIGEERVVIYVIVWGRVFHRPLIGDNKRRNEELNTMNARRSD
jgi:hypothetical protein